MLVVTMQNGNELNFEATNHYINIPTKAENKEEEEVANAIRETIHERQKITGLEVTCNYTQF